MSDLKRLRQELQRIDGRGYKAYKDIRGAWRFEGGALFIDHVQADPFAAPSKLRIRCRREPLGVPSDLDDSRVGRVALEDYLARRVRDAIGQKYDGDHGKPAVSIDAGQQTVLERTALVTARDFVEARLEVGLPAAGRKILGRNAATLLCEELPRLVTEGLLWSPEVDRKARAFVRCVENQEHIRAQLRERGLVAFVADGSVLPRASGVSDKPLPSSKAVLFESPESLRVFIDLPHPLDGPAGSGRTITGMGVPNGVTLIVGGGYHGKSTLLRALEVGVYPHVPGDGREYVVTDRDAVKVRAEDRRRIEGVRLTPFISGLPGGQPTDQFSTDEASGSTSQAAGLVEALESGASALLMDEDTCASNLMVRDARMQALVAEEDEPITPLVDRVQDLRADLGVSTVLVMGGSGDYFDVADTVVRMERYLPRDVTTESREVARQLPTMRRQPQGLAPLGPTRRAPVPGSVDPSRGKKAVKIDAPTKERLRFGRDDIDLRALDQLADISQTRAIGQAIRLMAERWMDGNRPLSQLLDELERLVEEEGLDRLSQFGPGKPGNERGDDKRGDDKRGHDKRGDHKREHEVEQAEHTGEYDHPHPGRLALPRRHELAGALNRLRSLKVATLEAAGRTH